LNKKIYRYFVVLYLLLSGCGVLLEPSKVVGKWKLESTEFYIYNKELDAYKKVTSTDSTNDSKENIYKGRFFLNTEKDYVVEFKDKGTNENSKTQFEIKNSSGLFVGLVNTEWIMDMFENSLTLQVYNQDTTSDNIWLRGLKIKNYWPLSKNNSKDVLELFIDANDTGKEYFKFDVSTDTVYIKSMKATFLRP